MNPPLQRSATIVMHIASSDAMPSDNNFVTSLCGKAKVWVGQDGQANIEALEHFGADNRTGYPCAACREIQGPDAVPVSVEPQRLIG